MAGDVSRSCIEREYVTAVARINSHGLIALINAIAADVAATNDIIERSG